MTFRELEVAMDHAADQARREFLQSVTTPILRDALAKADRWGEVGLADLFAGELQRRDQEERALSDTPAHRQARFESSAPDRHGEPSAREVRESLDRYFNQGHR